MKVPSASALLPMPELKKCLDFNEPPFQVRFVHGQVHHHFGISGKASQVQEQPKPRC